MYQLPVGNIEKIRKARKAVKSILSEIGLEDCQNLLKDLKENSEKNLDQDETFKVTDWIDFTDGFNGRRRRKWPYRSQTLCCRMCKYSSRSIYNFRSHVSRCHQYAQAVCALAMCSNCLYIGHPRALKKHILFFHSNYNNHLQPQREGSLPTHHGNERYQCRRCGFPSSSVFVMKKHIILKHLENLAEQYIGYRMHVQGTSTTKIYCCKVCKVNTGTLDQMMHHMLVEPSHYAVSTRVQSMIEENKNYTIKPTPNGNGMFVTFPNIAPKQQQQQQQQQQTQMFNNNSLVLASNGQSAGAVLALQQLPGTTNSTTLICAHGTNQAFLPPQASALVQLASAEAKGLLQPGATISLRSALPQGSSVVQLPTVSNVSLTQAPMALAPIAAPVHRPQNPQMQHILVPSGLQANTAAGHNAAPKPAVVAQNASKPVSLQGTMLTSQSLLSHLIPTGNKVNGMPTYTFAPLQVAMPVSQSAGAPLKSAEQTSRTTLQTKKWITCPLCNELFPSNVFDMHTEAAHKTKPAMTKSNCVAAGAAFLKKMPDKTIKCLTCKILLSEKSVFQHLLHGLNCLYCSALFFSVKQLLDHVKQHNPASKSYCDYIRQKYRVNTQGFGKIQFPYFDVTTAAPKEVLGDYEVCIALVTSSLELIYFKLYPSNQSDICAPPVKINSAYCPFCDEKFLNEAKHLLHLKQKHFVAPTIHAILKTEAFKCIYCNGVYTGKVTQQAIMLHIQRCRCSPKQPPKTTVGNEILLSGRPPKPAQPLTQPSGLYFLQMPQNFTMKQNLAPPRPAPVVPARPSPETEAELQSKKRLEAAWKEVMAANKREREEKAAMRKKRDQEKLLPPPPPPEVQSDPTVKLALEPTAVERRCNDERKDFINRYFNINPYPNKAEIEELCKRLSLAKTELSPHFGNKRGKCMKSVRKNSAAILLGFSMTELSKVKHNLLIPEPQPDGPEAPEPMEEGVKEKGTGVEPME